MKKTGFIIIVLFNLLVSYAQQEISVGFNFGVPVGNTDEYASFIVGVDAEYVYDVYDEVLYAGIASGFINAFTKDINVLDETIKLDNVQFAPIAAAVRYYLNYTFYAGADIGYALGVNKGNEGGFYYKPKMGFGFSDHLYINLSFVGVDQEELEYKSTVLGVEYRF